VTNEERTLAAQLTRRLPQAEAGSSRYPRLPYSYLTRARTAIPGFHEERCRCDLRCSMLISKSVQLTFSPHIDFPVY
jgi:hypothetical protein